MGIFNSKETTPPSDFVYIETKGFIVTDFDGGGDEGGVSSDPDYDKFLGRILASNATIENRSQSIIFLTNIKATNL